MKKEIYEKTEEEQIIHAVMLSDCYFICAKHGLNPILSGGALLGAVRDKGLISWSMGAIIIVDSDIAIKKQDEILSDLEKSGLKITRHFRRRKNWKIRADIGILNIEIVGYFRQQKFFVRDTGTRLKIIPAHFFENLTSIELHGARYSCPADCDEYLTHLYGNWKTPIKSNNAGDYRASSHTVKI